MNIELYIVMIGLPVMLIMAGYIFISDIKRRIEKEQLPIKHYVKIYSMKLGVIILGIIFVFFYIRLIA